MCLRCVTLAHIADPIRRGSRMNPKLFFSATFLFNKSLLTVGRVNSCPS